MPREVERFHSANNYPHFEYNCIAIAHNGSLHGTEVAPLLSLSKLNAHKEEAHTDGIPPPPPHRHLAAALCEVRSAANLFRRSCSEELAAARLHASLLRLQTMRAHELIKINLPG
jgi:hypothetical protein